MSANIEYNNETPIRRKSKPTQVPTEHIANSQTHGIAESDEEEAHHDKRERRGADHGNIPAGYQDLAQSQGLGPAQSSPDLVDEACGHDETEGVADEDERHYGIADIVVARMYLAMGEMLRQ